MRNSFFEDKNSMPLSNKILMAASVLCVIATIVVFIFFNNHQKNKNNTINNNGTQTTTSAEATAVASPTPEVVLDVIVPTESNISTRFNPPQGYSDVSLDQNSFGYYLRSFPLKNYGTKPLSFDSASKAMISNTALPAVSVLDLDLINKSNLQEASNSVIRLYAEYLYSQSRFSEISFNLLTTPPFKCDFQTWSEGGRLKEENNTITWCKEHGEHCTHRDVDTGTAYNVFKYYLQIVMNHSNISSLPTNMKTVQPNELTVGDIIIYADSTIPDIIVDMATDSTGNKICILARGGNPANELYIVRNENNSDINPWHEVNKLIAGASFYRFK